MVDIKLDMDTICSGMSGAMVLDIVVPKGAVKKSTANDKHGIKT